MGRRDGLLGQSQHIIGSMKQKKRYGAALATEAMTVQLEASYRKAIVTLAAMAALAALTADAAARQARPARTTGVRCDH